MWSARKHPIGAICPLLFSYVLTALLPGQPPERMRPVWRLHCVCGAVRVLPRLPGLSTFTKFKDLRKCPQAPYPDARRRENRMATVAAVTVLQKRKSSWLRKLGFTLLVIIILLAGPVGVFLWRPTTVLSSISRVFLWAKGVHGYDAHMSSRPREGFPCSGNPSGIVRLLPDIRFSTHRV